MDNQIICKGKKAVNRFLPFYLFTLLPLLGSCGTAKQGQPAAEAVSIEFNADSAYQFCAAQCQFGPRTMNSTAHEQCGQWIRRKFEQYGYHVHMQQADLRGYDGTTLHSTNIIATPNSPSPDSPSPDSPTPDSPTPPAPILICAHWDSRPWADNDPDSANWRRPVMAANDGASGVAVMLELARLIQQHDSLPAMAVHFACFDAEDWGIPQWETRADGDSWALGAQHWAANYPTPDSPPRYQFAILLDMVGGQGARFYREYYSMHYARTVVERVWQAASAAGYGSFFPHKDGGGVTDDHIPLNETAHIPTIDIIPYYPDCPQSTFGPTWHTVSDDLQHIDPATLKAVGQTLLQLIYGQ